MAKKIFAVLAISFQCVKFVRTKCETETERGCKILTARTRDGGRGEVTRPGHTPDTRILTNLHNVFTGFKSLMSPRFTRKTKIV